MNFKSFAPPHRIQRFTVLIFILSFLSCIILFILLHDYFFDLSISIVKSLEIERKRDDLFYQFFSFIETYICSDYVTYFILLLMYNYGNIFKSFILFVEIVLSKYFTGLFRLVFQQTPPYYDHSVPFSVINEHKFSFPSEKLILLPVFYMTLWEIAVKKGWVDSDFKPKLSENRAAILADVMADCLRLSPRWKPFEELWGIQNLCNKHSKSLNQKYYTDLQQEYKDAFR